MKNSKRLAAFLLVAALMAGLLAGCGSPEGEQATDAPGQEATGLVWTSEFTDLGSAAGYVSSVSFAGGKFYFNTSDYDEEAQRSVEKLWCVDAAAGTMSELTGYAPPAAAQESEDSYSYINSVAAAENGDLLVSETVSMTVFELPEGFSGTEEEKYEYADYVSTDYLRLLDSTGAEKSIVDLTAAAEAVAQKLQGQEDMYGSSNYLSYMCAGPDGSALLMYNQRIAVLVDAQGQVQLCEDLQNWWDAPIVLPDGRPAFRGYEGDGSVLRPFNFETKSFDEDISLPYSAYQLYPSAGSYSFCYMDSSTLYGYDVATQTTTKLAMLINCDIDESTLRSAYMDENDEIICLLSDYSSDKTELARVKQVDAASLPQVTTLRLACNYISQDLRTQVLNFNRANKDVRIEVVDYSQFNTEDDYSAGVTKLNTEIISGNVPDIFVSDQLPIEQYGAKGLLYDLYTLIDADGELSRESFIPNILKAMESDGKLYSIASSFGIMSLVGNADVVGEEMGWTLQEMMDVINAHPEVQYVLDPGTTKAAILQTMLALNLNEYVDWATGECSFNSQDFIDVLNFCNMFPEEYDYDSNNYESTPALVSSGRQLLATFSASDFDSFQMYEAMFGGHLAFKGFPSAEGNGNVIMPTGSSLSISSTCKDVDAAWRFIRAMLVEDYYSNENYYVYGYPINQAAFDAAVAKAMEKQYETDPETGEQVEVSTGGWGWDDFYIEVYAMSEEQEAQLRELVGSVERCYSYDQNIMNLVTEESADFFAGNKTAEQAASLIQDRVSIYVAEQS